MNNLLEKELHYIKLELENLSESIPASLSDEISIVIRKVEEKTAHVKNLSEKILNKTTSQAKNLRGLNTIYFWLKKTVNSLEENAKKEEKILSLKITKDLLNSALESNADDFVDPKDIEKQHKILNKRIINSQKILDEKIISCQKREEDLETYAIAFENQLASFSLAEIMKDEYSRFDILSALTSMAALFKSTDCEQIKLEKQRRRPNQKPNFKADHTEKNFELLSSKVFPYPKNNNLGKLHITENVLSEKLTSDIDKNISQLREHNISSLPKNIKLDEMDKLAKEATPEKINFPITPTKKNLTETMSGRTDKKPKLCHSGEEPAGDRPPKRRKKQKRQRKHA